MLKSRKKKVHLRTGEILYMSGTVLGIELRATDKKDFKKLRVWGGEIDAEKAITCVIALAGGAQESSPRK